MSVDALVRVQPPAVPFDFLSKTVLEPAAAVRVVLAYYSSYDEYVVSQGVLSGGTELVGDPLPQASDCSGVRSLGSALSTPRSEPSVNSSASTGRSARRARWRRNRREKKKLESRLSASGSTFTVSDCSAAGVPDQKCYGVLLVDGAAVGLGPSVTFEQLLAMPYTYLRSDCEAAGWRVCRMAEGVYHVAKRGVAVIECLGRMAKHYVHRSFPPGSIARVLARKEFQGVSLTLPKLADVLGIRGPGDPGEVTHLIRVDCFDPASLTALAVASQCAGVVLGLVLPDVTMYDGVVPLGARAIAVGAAASAAGCTPCDSFLSDGDDSYDLRSFWSRSLVQDGVVPARQAQSASALRYALQSALASARADLSKLVFVERHPGAGAFSAADVLSNLDPILYAAHAAEVEDYYRVLGAVVNTSADDPVLVDAFFSNRMAICNRLARGACVVAVADWADLRMHVSLQLDGALLSLRRGPSSFYAFSSQRVDGVLSAAGRECDRLDRLGLGRFFAMETRSGVLGFSTRRFEDTWRLLTGLQKLESPEALTSAVGNRVAIPFMSSALTADIFPAHSAEFVVGTAQSFQCIRGLWACHRRNHISLDLEIRVADRGSFCGWLGDGIRSYDVVLTIIEDNPASVKTMAGYVESAVSVPLTVMNAKRQVTSSTGCLEVKQSVPSLELLNNNVFRFRRVQMAHSTQRRRMVRMVVRVVAVAGDAVRTAATLVSMPFLVRGRSPGNSEQCPPLLARYPDFVSAYDRHTMWGVPVGAGAASTKSVSGSKVDDLEFGDYVPLDDGGD